MGIEKLAEIADLYKRMLLFVMKNTKKLAIIIVFSSLIGGLLPVGQVMIWNTLLKVAQAMVDDTGPYWYFITLGFMYSFYCILELLHEFLSIRISYMSIEVKRRLTTSIFQKVSRVPLDKYETPEFSSKLDFLGNVISYNSCTRLVGLMSLVPSNLITVMHLAVILSGYSVWLCAIVVACLVPSFLGSVISTRESFAVKKTLNQVTRACSYMERLLTDKRTTKDIRIFGTLGYLIDKWRVYKDKIINTNRSTAIRQIWRETLAVSFSTSGFGVALFICGLLIVSDKMSVVQFGTVIVLTRTLQSAISSLLSKLNEIYDNQIGFLTLFSFLEEDEENYPEEFAPLDCDIALDNVSYKYPNASSYALRNVNLHLMDGEKVAIVGRNGSGKSTLVKLICGLYEPTLGRVLYGERDIRELNKRKYRRLFSAVFQDYGRYSLTLRENVGIGRPEGIENDDQICDALDKAGVEKTSTDLLDRLDVVLDRRFGGIQLSGGQWQRIAIARGIFRDAPCFLLDEPTASIDPLHELDIYSKMYTISRNKSSIMISHRLGFARLADRIVVLKDGELIEEGSHDQLIALGGEYADLFREQAQWYAR